MDALKFVRFETNRHRDLQISEGWIYASTLASAEVCDAWPVRGAESRRLTVIMRSMRSQRDKASRPDTLDAHHAVRQTLALSGADLTPQHEVPVESRLILRWRNDQLLQKEWLTAPATFFDAWLRGAAADEIAIVINSASAHEIDLMRSAIGLHLGELYDAALQRRALTAASDPKLTRRAQLAEAWMSSADVSIFLGSKAANVSHLPSRLRRSGQLLAVYTTFPQAEYRFPPWQFVDGHLVAQLPEILSALNMPKAARRPDEGWEEAEWFLAPNSLLDGMSPAAVLAGNPDQVLAAARERHHDPSKEANDHS